jgi:hypothetical protein
LAISAPAVPLAPELPMPVNYYITFIRDFNVFLFCLIKNSTNIYYIFKGPGAYEVRDSKEPVKKYMSGAVFVSSTSRWINTGAQLADVPGPGQYSPNNKVKQSFLYNHEQKWV